MNEESIQLNNRSVKERLHRVGATGKKKTFVTLNKEKGCHLQRPISTLDNPTKRVDRPPVPFTIFVFDRLVFVESRRPV